MDIADFKDITDFNNNIMIFLIATHYEGKPTDSSVEFCKWIEGKKTKKDKFTNLKYGIFAFGSKDY